MKKWTLFFSISSLLLIVVSLVMLSITYGWFTALFSIPDGEVGVGALDYTASGSFVQDNTIFVPEEELVNTAFEVDNQSSLKSQLRIQITYTKVVNNAGTITSSTQIYHDDSTDHLSVVMNENFVQSGDYFYFGGDTYDILTYSGVISLITSIVYDGNFAGIDYENMPISISITIQVKQADNVTWSDLAGYDFSTGLPA
ncbi:MAG: hypothetical protein AB7U79_01135 [Candidatus Izemoplasmatales bacterium]